LLIPGEIPGIHDLRKYRQYRDVDGRDKPGHDARAGEKTGAYCCGASACGFCLETGSAAGVLADCVVPLSISCL
jgi:hypothetical protein